MESDNDKEDITFIDVMDEHTRDKVIRLEQKLKGLQAEIQAKLEAIEKYGEQTSLSGKEQLTLLYGALDLALERMDDIMSAPMAPGGTEDLLLETSENRFKEFSEQVSEIINTIPKVLDEL